MSQRFYDPQWWSDTIEGGIPLSFRYDELPTEELLVMEELSRSIYPGLRFNLRKQRGNRFVLTILPTKDPLLGVDKVKGQP